MRVLAPSVQTHMNLVTHLQFEESLLPLYRDFWFVNQRKSVMRYVGCGLVCQPVYHNESIGNQRTNLFSIMILFA